MLDSIPVSTACDPPVDSPAIRDTCRQMIRQQIPNFLRLYLNPYVAQTCYCLTRLVEQGWPSTSAEDYQVFLANSLEEALSGAIKLVRFNANVDGVCGAGVAFDEEGRLEHFASTELAGQGTIEYIPNLKVLADAHASVALFESGEKPPGFVVLFLASLKRLDDADYGKLRALLSAADRPFLIVCADRTSLEYRNESCDRGRDLSPDIVVFDESFVDFAVPFGAFAATKRLFGHWNKRGISTFHSTTFQPNTISNLHFMRCLRTFEPRFVARHAPALAEIERNVKYRHAVYRQCYSPSLARLISTVGLEQGALRAAGHYVETSEGRWFDAVAGVACSVRGHNPPTYVDDIEPNDCIDDCRDEIERRLHTLTGLAHFTPAVSGAAAVEQALKIALASQYPRNYVLALQGGFGGKTLFALTGTWNPSLRAGLNPLYPHVVYVDPFAADAVAAMEAACERYPIAVVQFELIQAVGGVRRLPANVRCCLNRLRERYGCLLFADEVQTGMYRTGPFVRARERGIQPDLLTLGKGTSDMMLPFSLTLHSEAIERELHGRGCSLLPTFRDRYSYEIGLRTIRSTLRRADHERLAERVCDRGELFMRLLHEQLKSCSRVREVRSFGLLIGIELEVGQHLRRWLKRTLPQAALLAMFHNKPFPLIAGFCQCEPHVLKLTPPLTITEDEVRRVCATVATVLRRSSSRLLMAGTWHAAFRPQLARLFGRP